MFSTKTWALDAAMGISAITPTIRPIPDCSTVARLACGSYEGDIETHGFEAWRWIDNLRRSLAGPTPAWIDCAPSAH